MREMEEGSRRVGSSGGVIKNRNSSGCLIIKKKADGSGAGGTDYPPAPGPVADKVYTSRKKRARVVTSEESSDEDDRMSEPYNGKGLPARGNRVTGSGSSLAYKAGTSRESDFIREKDLLFRSKKTLDIYDFDEYDDLDDVGRSGTGHSDWLEAQGSGRMLSGRKPGMTRGARREFEAAPSSRHGVMDDTKSFFSGSSSCKKFNRRLDAKSKIPVPVSAVKQKFDNSTSREAIRLQGKNGVLKLMVKNKTVGGSSTTPDYDAGEPSIVPGSRQLNSKNMQSRPSVFPERKVQSNSRNFDQIQSEKHRSRKPESSDSSEENSDGSAESDVPPKRPAKDVETHRPIKRERREDIGNSSPQTPPPSKLKEGKAKRGSGTEKQLLREKIRNMLVSAGWTIDYRPRRNRDYFDAVYINPSGTAYWSIIKAYDAFQKQLEEGALGECTPFNQISDEILSKLTRQTQKKLEKELKRKKREDIISKRKKKAGPGKFVNDEHEADSADTGSEEDKLSTFIKQNGRSLKGRSQEAHDGQGSSLSGKMLERNHRPFSASKSHFAHGRKTKTIGRCTLLVRNAEKGLNSEGDGFVPYKGKRTILSWLIDSGVVELSEKVLYMNRKRSRVLLEGWITRDGIHCGCCSKILTVSKFEIHAASKLRQPFQNIYLCSGNSLLQCQTDAWNSQDESLCRGFNTVNVDGDDPNDDTCGICGDGGDLICCDGCPSTYHQSCLGVEMLPPGDWHCPHCSCKFCGLADEISDVIKICSLCERKYHGSCIQEMDSAIDSSSNPTSLCGRKCQELFEQLQQLLGVKHELESGLSWSLIHRTDLETDPSSRGFSQRVEWNSKLAVALSVMDECFLPVIDRRSGVNLMHSVLYNCGSNFSRLNYSGFYTAILEKGDEIISAASIRIHGSQLAEMPFIGTRNIYRRQGMCRRLFFAIESALRALKVEKMMIPAISELMHTWTTVFGFRVLNETHKQEMKSLNMLVFPGVDMLQKKLLDVETSKTDAIMGTGTKITNNGSVSSPNETNVVETLQETDRRLANDLQESISSDRISFPNASLYAIDEVGPEALNRRDQETKISSMESNKELVDSAPDLKIGSLAGSRSDSLKAAQPPIGFPVDNDKPISAVCENTDANIIRILPVDSGLGSVFVSSAGASVEKSFPGHIDKDELYPSADLKTSASVSGEELESTSRLKEASPSDARRNTLSVQNSVLDEFQAGNEIEPMAANGEVHSAAGIKSRHLVSDVDASLVVNTGSDDAVSETNGSVVGNTNSVFEAPFASTLVLDSGSDNVDVAENANQDSSSAAVSLPHIGGEDGVAQANEATAALCNGGSSVHNARGHQTEQLPVSVVEE